MQLAQAQPEPDDPDRLAVEVARTVERLRSLSAARLAAPIPDGRSRAAAAIALAQSLVDRVAHAGGEPPRRLPELPDLAAGDVLAVCGRDLVDRLRDAPEPGTCRAAVEEVVALRRLL